MQTDTLKPPQAADSKSVCIQAAINRDVKRYVAIHKDEKVPYLLIKLIVYIAILGSAYATILTTYSFAIMMVAYIVFGLVMILTGLSFAHDLSHNTIFTNKRTNNILFEFIFALMGVSGYLWKKRHISSHHQHPNHEGFDPDLEIGSIINLSPFKKTKAYHCYQHIYGPVLYASYTLYWIFIKDIALITKPGDVKLAVPVYCKWQVIKLCFIKVLYLYLSIGVLYLAGNFSLYQLCIAFVLMHFITSYFLLFTFLITHHTEHTEYFEGAGTDIQDAWFYEQVRSSNDFHPFSRMANFIFGGFNCHIAHHLYPNTPHVFYPGITRIIYRHLRRNGTRPNSTTYWQGIISHLRVLKQRGVIT